MNNSRKKSAVAAPGTVYFNLTTKGAPAKPTTIADVIKTTSAGMSGGTNAPGMTPNGRAVEPDYYGVRDLNGPVTAKRMADSIESLARLKTPTAQQVQDHGGGIGGFIRAMRAVNITDERGTGPR